MTNFLAQASTMTDHQMGVAVGGGGLALIVAGIVKDMVREWIMSRTKVGKNLKNGSGCKMTQEIQDVILEKDGDRRRIHFAANEVEKQHAEMLGAIQKRDETLLKSSLIQEQILAELVRLRDK